MGLLLLGIALLLALTMIPLGLPGTWVMVLAGISYGYLAGTAGIGTAAIIGCVSIALVAELLDFTVAARYTRRYGGSRRGAWGAIVGGIAGAIVGVPIPIVGSVIGAIAGSFAGALFAEYSGGASHDAAARAATGAAIGRAVAMGLKAGTGVVIATWIFVAAWV